MILNIPENLQQPIGIISGALIAIAQITYISNTFTKKVTPSILSWYGWAFLMGTSAIAQILEKGWEWSMTSLVLSAFGCVVVATAAILMRNYSLHKNDWIFLLLGFVCAAVYLTSKNAWITTVFAIIADFVMGVPTLLKAWKTPALERSNAWWFGLASWTLALIICWHRDWLYALFPIYLFLYNGAMAVLTTERRKS